MALVSPGVETFELDVGGSVAEAGGSPTGVIIDAKWGPADQRVAITSIVELEENFHKPVATDTGVGPQYLRWFAVADYLGYGGNAIVARAVNAAARNAVNGGSAALIKNRTPIMGVVYAPVINKTWYGLINYGSYLIGKDKKPKKITLDKSNTDIKKIVSSRSHSNNPKLEEFLKGFEKYELVKMGSSMKMCLVADGTAHCYPRFGPTMEWDTGAAHAVVKYACGNIYNIETNKELNYNKENLLNPGFIVK